MNGESVKRPQYLTVEPSDRSICRAHDGDLAHKKRRETAAAMFKTGEHQSILAINAAKVYAIPGKHITTT
jgi:hypothetical protein